MPPNTPVCRVVIPKDTVSEPSGSVLAASVMSIIALIAEFITRKAIAPASAATSFSFLAIPIATPIAKSRGRLSKITEPQSFKTVRNEFNNVPSPSMELSQYELIIVALVNELPKPKNSPATGRIAIGSMNERPIR